MKLSLSDGVVRRVAVPLLRAFSSTWRYRVRHAERWQALHDSRTPFVYLLWHEALLPLLWLHRGEGVAIVVSEGKEGRYLSEYATRLKYHVIPGSSSRGGARALLTAVRALGGGRPVAFTPDGPRGPRREMKPGAIHAAQRAGTAILPLHAVAPAAWRFNSWDRMMVPRPLGLVEVGYGESFTVGPGDRGRADGVTRATEALMALEAELSGHGTTR